jgi:hypothetical protein
MPLTQKLFAIAISCCVLLFIIEMVRRKKLREEYSVLWLGTSLIMIILVVKYDWLVWLTGVIGAALPMTTLFLGSIIFLMLIAIQFSIKLSRLTDQLKNLAQENALLQARFDEAMTRKANATVEAARSTRVPE